MQTASRFHSSFPVLVPLLAMLVACGTGEVVEVPDAGHVARPDAGEPDAPDAGVIDESPDAGVVEETPDAGVVEETPDAGVTDPPDAGPVHDGVLRFIALGDTGTASAKQYAVAAAAKTVCESRGGCEFGLLLGDNFYDIGVKDANDELFKTMFEIPYGPLGFPIYPTLGNHDLGGEYTGGSGLNLLKGQYYLDYGKMNPQWVMPEQHHKFEYEPVTLLNLDSPMIFLGLIDDQAAVVPGWISSSQQPWKIAYGHHPYVSAGPHGNAGNYEGIDDMNIFGKTCDSSLTKIPAGCHLKSFVERQLCGKVDVYLSGHDHSLQDLGRTCGTEFLVSGAGAKTTDFPDRDGNAYHWLGEKPNGELHIGFLLLEATRNSLTFTFFDENATALHTRTITK